MIRFVMLRQMIVSYNDIEIANKKLERMNAEGWRAISVSTCVTKDMFDRRDTLRITYLLEKEEHEDESGA